MVYEVLPKASIILLVSNDPADESDLLFSVELDMPPPITEATATDISQLKNLMPKDGSISTRINDNISLRRRSV